MNIVVSVFGLGLLVCLSVAIWLFTRSFGRHELGRFAKIVAAVFLLVVVPSFSLLSFRDSQRAPFQSVVPWSEIPGTQFSSEVSSVDFARSMSMRMSVLIVSLFSCGVLKGAAWYFDREPRSAK